jgi:hypothetical protein
MLANKNRTSLPPSRCARLTQPGGAHMRFPAHRILRRVWPHEGLSVTWWHCPSRVLVWMSPLLSEAPPPTKTAQTGDTKAVRRMCPSPSPSLFLLQNTPTRFLSTLDCVPRPRAIQVRIRTSVSRTHNISDAGIACGHPHKDHEGERAAGLLMRTVVTHPPIHRCPTFSVHNDSVRSAWTPNKYYREEAHDLITRKKQPARRPYRAWLVSSPLSPFITQSGRLVSSKTLTPELEGPVYVSQSYWPT